LSRKTLTPVSESPAARPRSLAELLERGTLAALSAEARRRRDLTEVIRGMLPAEEAAHLVSASVSADDELILTMDASAWAARVKYRAAQLGSERRIRVRVQPVPPGQSGKPGTT
jgi:hypothetical protein